LLPLITTPSKKGANDCANDSAADASKQCPEKASN
jgi:hypothetical protein